MIKRKKYLLLMNGQIDADAFAQQGYLQSLEDIFLDETAYWPAILECGKIDGVMYGVPYEAQLYFATFSEKLTNDRDRWTLKEFMTAVRNSNTEVLQYGFNGADIVFYYGLCDNDNKDLIDWEKGESYLTEDLFKEFLEFAFEYADYGKIAQEDVGDALQDGRIAAQGSYILSLSDLNYVEACFSGYPANIGFPRTIGNGIYVTPNMLYLSGNSKVKEGAKEFLRFLVSEENQLELTREGDRGGSSSLLPIRFDAIERQLEIKKEEKFYFLLENARPSNWYAKDIMSMVYEELEPYFEGQRTAEEAMRILNNRVQLFLDER